MIVDDKFKVRAWDKKNGMTYQFSLHSSGLIAYMNNDWLKDDLPVLMQCIGYKDENGILMYEKDFIDLGGDIQMIEDIRDTYRTNSPVFGAFEYQTRNWDSPRGKCKVVGNAFENPDFFEKYNIDE